MFEVMTMSLLAVAFITVGLLSFMNEFAWEEIIASCMFPSQPNAKFQIIYHSQITNGTTLRIGYIANKVSTFH